MWPYKEQQKQKNGPGVRGAQREDLPVQQKKVVPRAPGSTFDPERHMSDSDATLYAWSHYIAGGTIGLMIGLILCIALAEIF